MAWLEQDPSNNFHVCFRFAQRKFRRSLKTKQTRAAQSRLLRLEENIRLVESGRLALPEDCDPAIFLLSDGKLNGQPKPAERIMLDALFEEFLTSLPEGAYEDNTLRLMKTHRTHLVRHLGARFVLNDITREDLQNYVTKRSKDPGQRGRCIGGTTIKKELGTFRAIWKWKFDIDVHPFPSRGLRFPKDSEKPPFQTWQEIERQIAQSELSAAEVAELWECLFLTLDEVSELLEHVRENSRQPFIYPMFVMAAHTGARRSELLRVRVTDFDEGAVIIREKKRIRGKRSYRRVPLSQTLKVVMDEWFQEHPGGAHAFCSRSAATSSTPKILGVDDAAYCFETTLAGSKWEKISGWHCLRHSFISNCAMKGVDQRLIDAWVGHTTEEMRRRYRHLFPEKEQAAIQAVFA